MADTKTYEGSCHCGKVKYRATLSLEQAIACNCSMCGRSGTLLTFIGPESFTLLQGEDALKDYQFNKHVVHHLFCGTCGIKPFARGQTPDGAPKIAVNVRCLQGVDLDALNVVKFDGRSK